MPGGPPISRRQSEVSMSDVTKLTHTCVNDLVQKAKVSFTGKEPRYVYQRLPAMREIADEAIKERDYEKAYIMLKRWLDSADWLRRTRTKDGKFHANVDQV